VLVREHNTDTVCNIHEANNKKKENKENKQTNNKVSKISNCKQMLTLSLLSKSQQSQNGTTNKKSPTMFMFSSWSSLPSRSRRSTSVTNTNTSTSRRRRPQLGTSYIPITLIILLAVSCSFSCGAGGVTAATLTDPSNVFLRRAPKSGQKRSSKSKKGYYSKSASSKKKSPPKKKSKSSKKTSLPTRQPTSDPTLAPSQAPSSSPSKVLWASSGGGWRSMAGEMGFANVFAQAGLITNESSAFSAVSTISGSSWFSTQFFYSSEFFTKTTTSTPDELAAFVLLWMDSYEAFSGRVISNPKCHKVFQNLTSGVPVLAELEALCNTVAEYDGDWAGLVQGMLAAASSAYGDPGLEDRSVGVLNRVNAMNETDLYIQTSLAPNSRTRFVPQGPGIFLGPIYNSNDVEIYSIPIAVQYSVRQTDTLYYSIDLDDGGTVLNYPISLEEVVSPELKFPKEYKEFGLYPVPLNKTIFDPEIEDLKPTQLTLTEPFGGKIPTVTQVSAASSAADALYSPMQPTVFSQAFSKLRDAVDGIAKKLVFDKVVDQLYEEEIFDGQSVCTQWPQECGETDGQFLDGYFTDACSLALNIGQYQSQNSDDTFSFASEGEEEALKVILTDTNHIYDTNHQGDDGTISILPYFNSPVNEGITPGDYMWPDNFFLLPLMSPQIFANDMDLASLAGIMKPIPGLDVTVGRVQATTLDNPRFHVKAGQPVDILILRLNSIIPTVIIGTEAIQAFKNPLAELAQGIAASEDLVNVIKDFMNVPAI